MNFRELKERVELYKINSTSDGAGGTIAGNPEKIGELWAKVEPMKASRTLESGAQQHPQTYLVTCRWRNDFSINTSLLLKHNGVGITVHSVQNVDFRSKICSIIGFVKS